MSPESPCAVTLQRNGAGRSMRPRGILDLPRGTLQQPACRASPGRTGGCPSAVGTRTGRRGQELFATFGHGFARVLAAVGRGTRIARAGPRHVLVEGLSAGSPRA